MSGTPPRQRLRHWLCLSCYRRPASADFWPWRAFVRAAHRLRRQLRSRLRRLPQPRLARCARLHPGLPGVNRKRLNITAHYPKPLRLPQQNCSRLGPLRALRVRVMVCYVLRPRPSQERYSALRVGSFSAARIVTYVQPWGRASAPAGALAGRLRRAVSWWSAVLPRLTFGAIARTVGIGYTDRASSLLGATLVNGWIKSGSACFPECPARGFLLRGLA